MPYNTFSPEITLAGQKINPLSDISNLGIPTTGNVVFVKHPSDADYRTVKEAVGRQFLFDTPQAAIDSPKIRNGKNDYILVCPRDNAAAWTVTGNTTISGTLTQGTACIVLNKSNVHLLGLGQKGAFGSASCIFETPGTAATSGIGTFGALFVTANNCEVAGFFFRGTNGTSAAGTIGAGTLDGAILGGMITVGTTVSGLYLHDFKVERTGAGWNGGTTGLVGTPRAMIDIGSGCQDITITNGYVNSGTALVDIHAIRLPFNGQNIVMNDLTLIGLGNAAASKVILTQGGTIPAGLYYQANRVAMANLLGTAMAGAIGGTMPVGAFAFVNESPAVGLITSTGTAGSCYVMPTLGVGTITTGGLRNPYIGVGTAAVIPAGGA